MRTPLTMNYQFDMVTHKREFIFRGQPRPRPKRVEPQRSPILGFSSIYNYTL